MSTEASNIASFGDRTRSRVFASPRLQEKRYHDIKTSMAQLIVRNLEDDVKKRLQERARRHRRSLEAEVRDILRNAAKAEEAPSVGLGTAIANRFRGHGLPEEIPELRGFTIEPPTFEE